MDSRLETALISATFIAGYSAMKIGSAAAASAMTVKISAVGAGVGAAIGGSLGAGMGIATGGTAISAMVPFAAAGAAVGSWTGPVLAAFGIGTAPAWAVPAAVAGQILVGASLVSGTWKVARWGYARLRQRAVQSGVDVPASDDTTCLVPVIASDRTDKSWRT